MDLIQNIKSVRLFEMYGKMLTDKQQQAFNLYVYKDLSLSEVSSILSISRQAVKYAIDNAIKSLDEIENRLGIVEKLTHLKKELETIKSSVSETKVKEKISKLMEEI